MNEKKNKINGNNQENIQRGEKRKYSRRNLALRKKAKNKKGKNQLENREENEMTSRI